jgi:RNA-directed DNA polymerase
MFSEESFAAWAAEECKNYEIKAGRQIYRKKGYLHFDDRLWFPENQGSIKSIIENGLRVFNPVNKRWEYHSFFPLLKILIKTPRYRYQFEEGHYDLETKVRPISFAAHVDSLIMGYYSYCLTRVYESYIKKAGFDESVLAYRSDLGKCNIQFAKEAFEIIKRSGECSAIALDIKGYFDSIDHELLHSNWKKVIGLDRLPKDQFKLFECLTKYRYVNQGSFLKKYKGPRRREEVASQKLLDLVPGKTRTQKLKRIYQDRLIVSNGGHIANERPKGIPQGSPMSALLSNMFLIDFDNDLHLKSKSEGFTYRRYCDDILIICDTSNASQLMSYIIDKIRNEYYLTIQHSKVELIDFRRNSKGEIRSFRRGHSTISLNGKREKAVNSSPPEINIVNEGSFYKSLQYLGFEFNGRSIFIRASSLSRYFRKLNYRLQRTVVMAHSPKSVSDKVFTKQIYNRYSHLGKRNFLSYAYNAAQNAYHANGKSWEGMNSPAIRGQLKKHMAILKAELVKK